MSVADLGAILRLGAAVTGRIEIPDGECQWLRAAPSAGALYPIELYCLALNVTGLERGWYHYEVSGQSLEWLGSVGPDTLIGEAFGEPEVVTSAATCILMTAVFPRTLYKYGNRGYRFILLEAGQICAHMYLGATSLGLGTLPLGGFLDDEICGLLGIDGLSEAPLYALAMGYSAVGPVATREER